MFLFNHNKIFHSIQPHLPWPQHLQKYWINQHKLMWIIFSVSGGWSSWSSWSKCSGSCGAGNGMKKRSRVCDNPMTLHGSQAQCSGQATQTKKCDMDCVGEWDLMLKIFETIVNTKYLGFSHILELKHNPASTHFKGQVMKISLNDSCWCWPICY